MCLSCNVASGDVGTREKVHSVAETTAVSRNRG